jgi:hypothetical protein
VSAKSLPVSGGLFLSNFLSYSHGDDRRCSFLVTGKRGKARHWQDANCLRIIAGYCDLGWRLKKNAGLSSIPAFS